MSLADRIASAVTRHSRIAIVVMLLLTVVVGAGAPMVESSSSLDQFQTESDESKKLDYIDANFSTGEDNTTTAQIIVRGDNVLSRDALISTLEFEQRLYDNETINATLVDDGAISGVANAVARTAIAQEEVAALQERAANLSEARAELEAERAALEARSQALNETAAQLRGGLAALQQDPQLDPRTAFEQVQANETSANATVTLTDDDYQVFERAAQQLRAATQSGNQTAIQSAYELGTQVVLADRYQSLSERGDELADRGERLGERADQLQADREALEDAEPPTLGEQIAQLESMNESEVEEAVSALLSENGDSNGPLGLMPNTYEPGATTAGSTMVFVTQTSDVATAAPGTATDENIDAQLAMQDLGDAADDLRYTVFGAGVITEEIDASMSDSLTIVGPLALLFVLVALVVAYRDPLDIVLGLLGIAGVLTWTFGFMGWADIAFNQIFVAVPVLLIGLSIDYAIHVFMRHREERQELSEMAADGGDEVDSGPRNSMRIALGGVGIALLWVTATTVIGFLSNLTSPVPPIRDFGIVSSVGILAALFIFGVLIPALKVELDELLESYGFDRTKRAFGTGGGRFSSVLSVGATVARRAPHIVILLVVLVSVVGAYGGTQVSTEFQQEDFLADDPPDWMKDLPEPFKPSEYTAKSTLSFVNDRFIREDSNAELLIEGDVTQSNTLERIAAARQLAGEKNVTQTLPNGEPALTTPVSVMRDVAATNETFNATFTAADTDGDGVPDQNVTAVYDGLFDVAPDRAGQYIYRTDGGYESLRMTVSIVGGASGGDVTDQMRDVAGDLTGDGLETTATGTAVLNKIVQDQLLETVIQSLIISLLAVFLFLMATYRVSDGSASLGAVTLLPVAFAVAWIVGTMYLLDVPFNVVTGMITSLTIGLGVAYSIHLSERYTQELERSETVWEAMHTAVTGTGGALLGSAATTVGGFGVLVFAILPPLQQFGLITGLTIIYAFLGSVFVLPSLLVVWTRYFGPDWARDQIRSDGDADGPDGVTVTNGDAPAVTNGQGAGSVATRTVDHEHVRPGQDLTVEVALTSADGRVGLREHFDGNEVSVVSVDPEPESVATHGGTLYAVWDLDDEPVRVTYTATVPQMATDGEAYTFEGTVLTAAADREVTGDEVVRVVADLFERVVARGTVTADDLAAAEERLAAGELSEAQFERIYRTWLGETEVLEAARTTGED
ncbi:MULTISPECIES: MMPL family transporter [Salinibaculum]|uniref:MMPL family transporter n=1 Tax=Salinibaculum TaxID=2732368 RepID=UPI0030CB0C1D